MRCYVAAPYGRASFVRADVHQRLRELGCTPTSSWADQANGKEVLSAMTATQVCDAWLANRRALRSSDVVLVLADEPGGGETFCELEEAHRERIPLLYVGAPMLTAAYAFINEMCTIVATIEEAMVVVGAMAKKRMVARKLTSEEHREIRKACECPIDAQPGDRCGGEWLRCRGSIAKRQELTNAVAADDPAASEGVWDGEGA